MNTFTAPYFHDESAARAALESILWPTGPICPKCGEAVRRYATVRPGRYRCGNPECRKDYTVTTGTVMERSHIKLHKWLMGFYLMASSKKGVSAHQLHRSLGIGYEAAWFMAHRLREAMRDGGLLPPLGGNGGVVEADETYYGPVEEARPRNKYLPPPTKGRRTGPANKRAIVALTLNEEKSNKDSKEVSLAFVHPLPFLIGGQLSGVQVPHLPVESASEPFNMNIRRIANAF